MIPRADDFFSLISENKKSPPEAYEYNGQILAVRRPYGATNLWTRFHPDIGIGIYQ